MAETIEIGRVRELVRYPMKSMAGLSLETAEVGWHGLQGDRRFAFRRTGEEGGFPWLSASRLSSMLAYRPEGVDESSGEPLPTHLVTPEGDRFGLGSPELDDHVSERFGHRVELMKLKHGIFDEATVSLINLETIAGIEREAGMSLDRRRFRANVTIESTSSEPFAEDDWVGSQLILGDCETGVVLGVTLRDLRCVMVNLDPDSGEKSPHIMKAVVRLNENHAGVYATVLQTGTVRVDDPITLVPSLRG